MTRAMRLLRLIGMLNERAYSTEELAACLEVSRRTIQRDCQGLTGPPLYLPVVKRVRHEWRLLTKLALDATESCA